MTESLDAVMATVEHELNRDKESAAEVAARAPAFSNMSPGKTSVTCMVCDWMPKRCLAALIFRLKIC